MNRTRKTGNVYEKTYKTYLNLYKSLEPMMRNEEEK